MTIDNSREPIKTAWGTAITFAWEKEGTNTDKISRFYSVESENDKKNFEEWKKNTPDDVNSLMEIFDPRPSPEILKSLIKSMRDSLLKEEKEGVWETTTNGALQTFRDLSDQVPLVDQLGDGVVHIHMAFERPKDQNARLFWAKRLACLYEMLNETHSLMFFAGKSTSLTANRTGSHSPALIQELGKILSQPNIPGNNRFSGIEGDDGGEHRNGRWKYGSVGLRHCYKGENAPEIIGFEFRVANRYANHLGTKEGAKATPDWAKFLRIIQNLQTFLSNWSTWSQPTWDDTTLEVSFSQSCDTTLSEKSLVKFNGAEIGKVTNVTEKKVVLTIEKKYQVPPDYKACINGNYIEIVEKEGENTGTLKPVNFPSDGIDNPQKYWLDYLINSRHRLLEADANLLQQLIEFCKQYTDRFTQDSPFYQDWFPIKKSDFSEVGGDNIYEQLVGKGIIQDSHGEGAARISEDYSHVNQDERSKYLEDKLSELELDDNEIEQIKSILDNVADHKLEIPYSFWINEKSIYDIGSSEDILFARICLPLRRWELHPAVPFDNENIIIKARETYTEKINQKKLPSQRSNDSLQAKIGRLQAKISGLQAKIGELQKQSKQSRFSKAMIVSKNMEIRSLEESINNLNEQIENSWSRAMTDIHDAFKIWAKETKLWNIIQLGTDGNLPLHNLKEKALSIATPPKSPLSGAKAAGSVVRLLQQNGEGLRPGAKRTLPPVPNRPKRGQS